MPPNRTSSASTQKTKAFKPVRPTSKATATPSKSNSKRASTAGKRKSKGPPQTPSDLSASEEASDEEPRRQSRPAAQSPVPTASDNEPPVIPERLLQVLLKHHYEDKTTNIGADARKLVAKYMETFVREAVARAIVERKGTADDGGSPGVGGDFLEVSSAWLRLINSLTT